MRLYQVLGMILLALGGMNGSLHRACSSPRIHAHHAYAVWIHLVTQTVRDRAKGVFGCRILTQVRASGLSCARIDEHDLPLPRFQHREQELGQEIGCANIDAVLPIQILDRGRSQGSENDFAGAMN